MKFLLLLALVPLATCFVVVPGKCPELKGVENFDPEKLTTGEWYTVKSFPHPTDVGYKCDKDKLNYNEQGFYGQYEVFNQKTNTKELLPYKAVHIDAEKTPLFDFSSTVNGAPFILKNVYILDTDYDNYLLYYSCNEEGGNSQRLAWLQAKNKRTLDEEYLNKAYKFIDQHELGSEHFKNFDQSDC